MDALEDALLAVEPVRVRTKLAVYARGVEVRADADTFRAKGAAYINRLAEADPVVELIGTYPDLDVLIDAESGLHVVRDGPDDAEFDELAEGVRVIDVTISCHEAQVEQIVSSAATTATMGGARAGKTRILAWWLFRQWLLRGHGVDEENPKPALFWWIREDSEKLYEHAIQWLLALWPRDVFTGQIPGPKTKHPKLYMVDGSVIAFRHAHHSGRRAGTNLRSASVSAAVVDELTAIVNRENYLEIMNRLGQTAGPLATAYTPISGHWAEEDIEKAATSSAGAIQLRRVDLFDNPWWPLSRAWKQFLRDRSLDASSLFDVLTAEDQCEEAYKRVQDPDSRRRHFGMSAPVGLRLWRSWRADEWTLRGPVPDVAVFEGQPNITAHTAGSYFGKPGAAIQVAAGVDFNVNPGVAVVFAVFGTLELPLVVVLGEVTTIGPTIKSARAIASAWPGLCLHCDPVGAMGGRAAAHGSSEMTNSEELELAGLYVEPAAGWRKNKVLHLDQLDSINAMHRAMELGLLRVHESCTGVLRALRDMRATPDGKIKKTSGVRSESDQISAYGDALRYGVWRVYSELYGTRSAVH